MSIVVDTGAAVSLLPESVFKDLFPDTDLQPSDMVLRTYTGESISVCGQCCVNVVYGNQAPCNLGLVVVRGRGPSLLGCNWLRDIRLDWPQIFSVRCNTETTLAALLKQYEDVFAPGLGTIKNYTADLCVKESAKPVFCSVPLSQVVKVEFRWVPCSGVHTMFFSSFYIFNTSTLRNCMMPHWHLRAFL